MFIEKSRRKIMHENYEVAINRNNFYNAFKIFSVSLLIVFLVLLPAFWLWDQSIQQRLTLREAKNVLMNMELLSIEYYGFDKPIADTGRPSGMSLEAEDEILSFAGAEGTVCLISWDEDCGKVLSMSYQKGRFLVQYQYEKANDTYTWDIYWMIHQYDNQR